MFLLYHAYVYLEFLILACTIYILASRDATIFAAQTGLKMVKMRERRNKELELIKIYFGQIEFIV